MLEGITENGLPIHLSSHPSVCPPYERRTRTEREMKYKHTVLYTQRRSNLLQRTERVQEIILP
jgi:hypothetical protein